MSSVKSSIVLCYNTNKLSYLLTYLQKKLNNQTLNTYASRRGYSSVADEVTSNYYWPANT